MKLNLGCGKNHLDGYINVDKYIENNPDVLCDLEKHLPFDDNSVDYILGSHIMEHIYNLTGLMEEIWRICKNNAVCFFITPYLSSDDTFGCPHHVRGFDENTWHYFNQKLYQIKNSSGYADHGIRCNFQIIECALIPYKEFLNDPELDFKKKHYRNIIQELQVKLEVIK